ncbi:hypothetical protein B0I37DRAFT_347854 [Chaetomium sp. MPI-CAGE-AT-0009]|nr:hypothetical protein B0I37DRAFT_347854 [Chaetomium sp. MPI-CAGE-AT-0009]
MWQSSKRGKVPPNFLHMAATPAFRPKPQLPRSLPSIINRWSHPSAPHHQLTHIRNRHDRPLSTRQPTHVKLFCRPFMSSPQQAGSHGQTRTIGMEWYDLSPEGKIQWLLNSGAEDKWGWVIYRCTYKPELDGHWKDFRRRVENETRKHIAESDAPGIAEKLDWVFVEDPELANASREELKRRFRAWAQAENPNCDMEKITDGRGARYTYFIQIDEAALLSMADTPNDPRNLGHVNIVRAWEDPLPPEEATSPFGEAVDSEDWMKMQPDMIDAEFYIELDHDEAWYTFYRPPPHQVCRW